MRGKYNSNDSLFSVDYKIPYESSIKQHLEESQEEINFIKYKLTEAYQKLEAQIKHSTSLEDQNEVLERDLKDLQEKNAYERKENVKLKETLQIILKNRKIMQEDLEQFKQTSNKKLTEKEKIIEDLQRQLNSSSLKISTLATELENKDRQIKEYSIRVRDASNYRSEQDNQREFSLVNKIQILEQQITRITEEKFVQVNRLRHELSLYQKSATPFTKQIRIQDRKRDFSRPTVNRRNAPKFDTKMSQQCDFDFNKENVNSEQNLLPNVSLEESSIAKWKRHQSNKQVAQQPSLGQVVTSTDDQQLSQYQISRKKAEQQLCGLEKIKRPTNEQRERITRLQREIYHLDSDIAGLKRKIRKRY